MVCRQNRYVHVLTHLSNPVHACNLFNHPNGLIWGCLRLLREQISAFTGLYPLLQHLRLQTSTPQAEVQKARSEQQAESSGKRSRIEFTTTAPPAKLQERDKTATVLGGGRRSRFGLGAGVSRSTAAYGSARELPYDKGNGRWK